MSSECLHCERKLSAGQGSSMEFSNRTIRVCGRGCATAVQRVIDGGHQDYYRFRTGPSQSITEDAVGRRDQWLAFDESGNDVVQSDMIVEGIRCGACTWLIEQQIGRFEGVESVNVDQPSSYVSLRYRPGQTPLSLILGRLTELGFRPHPMDETSAIAAQSAQNRDLLKRFGVAGLGMMQVMMYTAGTYFGPGSGMDPAIERLLTLVSMVVAAPVVFYAGAPFLSGAIQALKNRAPNMDVPVALALTIGFCASCFNYFRGSGPTYFESVSMFVFLLLASRLIAAHVGHRATLANLALAPLLPDVVTRIEDGVDTDVRRSALRPGDVVRVRPGDAIAADGTILSGHSAVNESLLTGEATPRTRGPSDAVLAGSINVEAPIKVRITAVGQRTAVAEMASLLAKARSERPKRVKFANQVASYFVTGVIFLSTAVFLAWLTVDIERALSAALAVLVVTCPCALSLAIPAALSAAATRLASEGLLVSRLDSLEAIADVDVALFDKTGTLTIGRPEICQVLLNRQHPQAVEEQELLEMAASLERNSSHPLARAFDHVPAKLSVDDPRHFPGLGISGTINQRHVKVGNAEFTNARSIDASHVFVSDELGVLGSIRVSDPWRADAKETLAALTTMGFSTQILSGDTQQRVTEAVVALDVEEGIGGLNPQQKIDELQKQQAVGKTVLAVGDGVNDSGLLAGADASVAMASGTDLAQAGADIVLVREQLSSLVTLVEVSRRVRQIIRQNISWAIGYNLIAVPMAALGLIGPAAAAAGMSASSLIVVLNAARLLKPTKQTAIAESPARSSRRAYA